MEIINRKLCGSNKTTGLKNTDKTPFDNYRTIISDAEYLLYKSEITSKGYTDAEKYVEEENHHDLCTVCQDKYDYINCVMNLDIASSTNKDPKTLPSIYNLNDEILVDKVTKKNSTRADNYTQDAYKFGVLKAAYVGSTLKFGTGYINKNFFNTIDALTLNTSRSLCRLCSYETSFKDAKTNMMLSLEHYIYYFLIGNFDKEDKTGKYGGCLRTGHLDKTVLDKKFVRV